MVHFRFFFHLSILLILTWNTLQPYSVGMIFSHISRSQWDGTVTYEEDRHFFRRKEALEVQAITGINWKSPS